MKKKNKRSFEDRTHRKATRSTERRESKSKRHQTKDMLHKLSGGNLDKHDFYDMIDETLEDSNWR